MNLEVMNFLIPIITAIVVWCVVRPQAVENKVLHKAIDNNTEALNRLTEVVNDLKNDMVQQAQRVRTLEREMSEVRQQLRE